MPRQSQGTRGEQIVFAALELFASCGHRGASIAAIAEAAGISEPGLIHHFPSKTALLLETLEFHDPEHRPRLADTGSTKDHRSSANGWAVRCTHTRSLLDTSCAEEETPERTSVRYANEERRSVSTRNLADEDLTNAVVASFDGARTERFRTIAESLVKHLHAFASEVQLTEEEWFKGIDFLTRTGHITDDKRQEFVLLSDVLGLSMLVVGINNRRPPQATESTVFGPFFVEHSPAFENGDDIAKGFSGEPCFVSGRVVGVDGEPVVGARVEIWQADDAGFYDVQTGDEPNGRGHLFTGEEGRFSFWSVKPEAYPIPADGPVGELLEAGGRGPMRPAHIHFMVTAEGYQRLITHVFVEGDEHLDSDAVFGVRSALIAPFVRDGDHWTASYDLVLARS